MTTTTDELDHWVGSIGIDSMRMTWRRDGQRVKGVETGMELWLSGRQERRDEESFFLLVISRLGGFHMKGNQSAT